MFFCYLLTKNIRRLDGCKPRQVSLGFSYKIFFFYFNDFDDLMIWVCLRILIILGYKCASLYEKISRKILERNKREKTFFLKKKKKIKVRVSFGKIKLLYKNEGKEEEW